MHWSKFGGPLPLLGIKKAAQEIVPETKLEVERFADPVPCSCPNVLACTNLAATEPYIAEFTLLQTEHVSLIAFFVTTMEARYVEAGSMSIFWTQNRGGTRWIRALLYGGTQIGLGGPGQSQLFSTWDPNRVWWDAVGPGGSQVFVYVGPYTPFGFFYHAN